MLDSIDWRGCDAVEFDPLKLGGRATVGGTRMDADGILINYESGMTVDDLQENFGVDREAVEKILAFGVPRRLNSTISTLCSQPIRVSSTNRTTPNASSPLSF